jgi:hypothetical protein
MDFGGLNGGGGPFDVPVASAVVFPRERDVCKSLFNGLREISPISNLILKVPNDRRGRPAETFRDPLGFKLACKRFTGLVDYAALVANEIQQAFVQGGYLGTTIVLVNLLNGHVVPLRNRSDEYLRGIGV